MQIDAAMRENIHEHRAAIEAMVREPMRRLTDMCIPVWRDRTLLDGVLLAGFHTIPHCKFIYAMSPNAVQVGSNIAHHGLIESDYRRDRSQRPYMLALQPGDVFRLSESYISIRERRPSITAVHAIIDHGHLIGFLAADFDLRSLPFSAPLYEEPKTWRQLKGDPSIRGGLFQQTRTESLLDQNIETITAVMTELFVDRGLFHGKIHFASSRATVWFYDDPYRYRILGLEALTDPDICMAFPRRDYPEEASTPIGYVREVLQVFRELRLMDDTLYLRSGSLNVINNMVGLTFSCDGSHYMSVDEFLDKDLAFWIGEAGSSDGSACA